MKVKSPVEFQTFNDGIIDIYSTDDKGSTIKDPIKYEHIPYENRIIGYQRNFVASQAHINVSALIRIPVIPLDGFDVIKLNNHKHSIKLKQDILDTNPKCIQLSLEDDGVWV